MNPLTALSNAISAVEQAGQAYNGTVVTTTNDQSVADGLKAKLDTANAQVATDKQGQTAAATAFNSALDALATAVQAAKIPTS
jgi:hypothetical protein